MQVFVSFTGEDRAIKNEIVEKLRAALKPLGHTVWEADEGCTSDFSKESIQAIRNSQIFIVILSKSSMNMRSHVINEVIEAKELAKQLKRIIYKVDDAEMPEAFRFNLNDVSDANHVARLNNDNTGIDALVAKVCRLLVEMEGSYDVKAEDGISAIQSRLPLCRGFLLGREVALQKIDLAFEEGERLVFLEGMGGIGKSEIAKRYAHAHKDRYRPIIYLNYRDSLVQTLLDERDLAITGISRYVNESETAYFNRKLNALVHLTDANTLIIIDNFDKNEEDDPFFHDLIDGDYRLLFTTRNTHECGHTIKIEPIRDDETMLRLFAMYYDEDGDKVPPEELLGSENIEPLKRFFRTVDYHTYIIEIAAKLMRRTDITASELLEQMSSSRIASISDTVPGRDGKHTPLEHISTLFSISSLSEEEKYCLSLLSLLGNQGMTGSFLKDFANLSNLNAVNELYERGLIKREKRDTGARRKSTSTFFSLHPLIREAVHADIHPSARDCEVFLTNFAAYAKEAWYREVDDNKLLTESADSILEYFVVNAPNTMPDMDYWYVWESLNDFLWQLARFDNSIRYGHILLEAARQQLGEKSCVTAYLAKSLGACYYNANRLRESVQWYELGLRCMAQSGSEYQEDLAMSYEKAGRCYIWDFNRDLQKAEDYLNITLKIRQKLVNDFEHGLTPGLLHPLERYDLSIALDRLGQAWYQLGHVFKAVGRIEDALECARKYLGSLMEAKKFSDRRIDSAIGYAYKDIAICYYLLALKCKQRQERDKADKLLAEAAAYLKQVYEIDIRMRSELSFDVAETLEYLGDIYLEQEQLSDAITAYRDARRIHLQLAGSEDEDVRRLVEKIAALESN